MFLKLSKIPQEKICAGVYFKKVAGLTIWKSTKKRLQNRCFPMKFAKILRAPFLQNSPSS